MLDGLAHCTKHVLCATSPHGRYAYDVVASLLQKTHDRAHRFDADKSDEHNVLARNVGKSSPGTTLDQCLLDFCANVAFPA